MNKLKKMVLPLSIIINILVIFVCSFLNRISVVDYHFLAISLWVLLGFNFIFIIIYLIKRKYFRKEYLLLLLMILFGFLAFIFAVRSDVALFGFPNRYEGLLSLLYYYSIFMLSSFLDKKYRKVIINFILVCGLIQLIYGILQMTGIRWVSRSYQVYNHKSLRVGDSLVTGFTSNPNFFSSFMLLCLTYSLGLFVDYDKKDVKTVYGILSFLFMIGLLIGNTMSCLVGLVFVLIYIFIYCYRSKKIINFFCLFLILLISTLIIYFTGNTYLVNDSLDTTIETKEIASGNIKDSYGTGRVFIWKNTLNIVPKYFWFGAGEDNFYYAFGKKPLSDWYFIYDKVHNEYLQILVTEGIFALLSYLAFYFVILYNGIKMSFNIKEIYFILPVIGYLVQAFFNISVIEVAPFFFIALGLCLGENYEKGKCDSSGS